jgi:serine/threonine protein kinase
LFSLHLHTAIKPRADGAKLVPKASPEARDLLEKMLMFDPAQRITVVDALRHPYLASLHHPEDEPDCASLFEMEDNVPDDALKKRDIQLEILEEVIKIHPEFEKVWRPQM